MNRLGNSSFLYGQWVPDSPESLLTGFTFVKIILSSIRKKSISTYVVQNTDSMYYELE